MYFLFVFLLNRRWTIRNFLVKMWIWCFWINI
jgi:hypothetical protein